MNVTAHNQRVIEAQHYFQKKTAKKLKSKEQTLNFKPNIILFEFTLYVDTFYNAHL